MREIKIFSQRQIACFAELIISAKVQLQSRQFPLCGKCYIILRRESEFLIQRVYDVLGITAVFPASDFVAIPLREEI